MADEGLTIEGVWARVRGRMRLDCGESEFRSWLKPLELVEAHPGGMVLAVPSRFMRDWVATHYLDRIGQISREEVGRPISIEVVARPSQRPVPKTEDSEDFASAVGGVPIANGISIANGDHAADGAAGGVGMRNGRGEVDDPMTREKATDPSFPAVPGGAGNDAPMGATLDPSCKFDNFVVGKPNEFAHAAARRVAEAETVPFNPLFLYGGVGLGKTHLMHAIAWEMRERYPQRRVLYMSAEYFMYQFIAALRHKTTVEFKRQLRAADVLMVDDIQFICGKDSTQEEFFHTFNALADQNRQIVLSADKSPADLDDVEARLRSRLGWGVVADIHPTDYELRLGILQARAERLNFKIAEKVLEFIAHRITGNVRELEGALNRLDAHASLIGREITLDAVPDLLRDLLRANDRRLTIEEIQRHVAEHYNVKYSDMLSARRARAIARPRQIAMYFAKQLTSRSLPEIGRKFGGRDHTTVMHAVRRVEELCVVDSSFADDVDRLRRKLEGG